MSLCIHLIFNPYRVYYCPNIYDIKHVIKSVDELKGGLQKIAETLEVHRVGPQHQAGSDSLMTAATFFRMVRNYFEGELDDQKYLGIIYGLGVSGAGKLQLLLVGRFTFNLVFNLVFNFSTS